MTATMTDKERFVLLAQAQRFWTQGWSEEAETQWLADFFAYEYVDMAEGLRRLHDAHKSNFVPGWGLVVEQVHAARAERMRRENERRAALSPAQVETEQQRATSLRLLRLMRRAMAEPVHHQHAHGDAKCPTCSKHDHSNTTAFGFTVSTQRADRPDREGNVNDVKHQTPVPGWHFDCSRCGNADAAQHACDTWTFEGIAFMRAHRGATVPADASVF